MKNPKLPLNILLFIFVVITSGCSQTLKDPVLRDFKKTQQLKHIQCPIKSIDMGEIVDILIMDSILITNEMYNNYIFKLYNTKTGKMINQCIRKGRGPNEIQYPNLMNAYNDNTITTFDVNKKEIIYLSISELCKKNPNIFTNCQLDFGIFRVASINDSLILCTGIFDDGEYYLINKNSKHRIAKLDFPTFEEMQKINNVTKGFIFQGELALRPYHQEFVKVSSGAGVIEIGKFNNSNLDHIFTKIYFYPEINLTNNQPIHSKKSKFAFHSLIATEKYFYTIYSGKSIDKEGREFSSGRNLLVYNWTGDPIVNYQLDRDIKRMTIDDKKKIAYGYSINPVTGEPEIVIYQLPE